jgi:hypothetical protein
MTKITRHVFLSQSAVGPPGAWKTQSDPSSYAHAEGDNLFFRNIQWWGKFIHQFPPLSLRLEKRHTILDAFPSRSSNRLQGIQALRSKCLALLWWFGLEVRSWLQCTSETPPSHYPECTSLGYLAVPGTALFWVGLGRPLQFLKK